MLVENLRLLDLIRRPALPVRAAPISPSRPSTIVWLVLALAAVQTAGSLGAVAIAFMSGQPAVYRTSQIVLGLAFAGASLLLGAATSGDRRSIFLLATFAAAASAFARAALTGLPEAWSAPLDPILRGLFPEAFAPATLWQFAVGFPRVRRFTAFDVLARRATAAAWVLGTVLFGVNLASAYHMIDAGTALFLQRNHPGNAFWHLFALAVIPAVGTILVRSRRAPLAERRKVARFAMAFAAGTAPFLLCGVSRMMLPQVDDWLLTARPLQRLWVDRLIIGALTATPILGTMAVIVDRPFEFQAIPSCPSRERLASAGLTALLVAPFIALLLTLYQLRHVAMADLLSSSRGSVALACAAVGLLLLLARPMLLNALDARGLRRAVDHRERLAAALEHVRVARGAREVSVVLARELQRSVGASARVLVPTRGGGFVDWSRAATRLDPDSVLIAMLADMTRPLDLSDRSLRALLPQRDREWVVANGVEFAAPLKRRDATIAAILVFGRKRGDRAFDRRDRWLVGTLISAAAGVWDTDGSTGTWNEADRSSSDPRESEAAFECRRCGLVGESTPLPCGCGSEPVLASLPRHLGQKFAVERRVGAGGMGVVYLARDTTLDREVALKTLPDLRDGTVARLREEARAMAGLNHESLATLYGLELWRRTPVLVVEYFPGGTLARKLAAGPLSPGAVVALGIRIARALAYMHERGVLHRDLKPSNIGFTATGAPKLLDFGLAALIGSSLSITLAGTPAYLPPEAYEGTPPNPAFDLWALSIAMLEAMTGRNPVATTDHARAISRRVQRDLNAVSLRSPGALLLLSSFFARALAVQPELRFQTSLEAQSALEALEAAVGS